MFRLDSRKVRNLALILGMMFLLTGCVSAETLASPIAFEGSFFSKFIVYPVGWLLFQTTKVLFGNFTLGILATTIIVRTLAWPIYAKGNSSQMRMQEMQPELMKLQAKYAGKNDTHSQQRMQIEIQQLYKKYNVSMFGCFTPFLQMPIFLAVYNAVVRLPQNLSADNVLTLGSQSQTIDPYFFGINMFERVSVGIKDNFLFILIPILSAGSMLLMQYVIMHHQKKNQPQVPEYRRNPQADAMQNQMKWMTIMMTLMFAWISYTSVATLGFYWTVGNLYSLAQQLIAQKQRENYKKKKAKENEIL